MNCLTVSLSQTAPVRRFEGSYRDPIWKQKQLTVNEFSVGIRVGWRSGELGRMDFAASSRSRTRHLRHSGGHPLNPCKSLKYKWFADDLMNFSVLVWALLYLKTNETRPEWDGTGDFPWHVMTTCPKR